jgi:hypothetical protein
MGGSQVFVGVFAIVSVAFSAAAIWRVAMGRIGHKPLWIIGSAFGFVGVATDFGHSGDLYLQFGLQIPVVRMFWVLPAGGPVLKAMFPFIAVAALVKCHSSQTAPGG